MADARAPSPMNNGVVGDGATGSAMEIAAAIAAGTTSARQQCAAAIARIEAGDGPINAVVVRDFERALAQADAADAAIARGTRLPLLGVPMTVKEAFDVKDLPTTWGDPNARDYRAARDAVAVQRFKSAGAIILGKTNVAPALADWISDNPVYGRTANPHDLSRTSGGSSGGSAAALAAGFVPLELGSDIGGSIRIPSAFCGTWGHKPTHGLIDDYGHSPAGTDYSNQPLNVVGPMARNAQDLALAMQVLANHPLHPALNMDGRPLRILILDRHPNAPQAQSYIDALAQLEERAVAAGMTVVRDHPALPDLAAQHRAYCKMLGITFSRGAPDAVGRVATMNQWFDLIDAQARNRRTWGAVFADVHAVVTPANVTTAFPHRDDPYHDRRLDIDGQDAAYDAQLVWPGLATYPGLPATAFPAATDPMGLPLGFQVMCDTGADLSAIAIADLLFGVMS